MYAVVDIETTGGDGHNHRITEIAVYRTDGQKEIDHFTTLVNPCKSIPYFITKLTGITDQMVASAPPFYEVADKVIEYTQDCTFVAHNVNFDYSIIKGEFKRLGYNYLRNRMCTANMGRKLVNGLPSYALGSLCKHFGISIQHRHRAYGDAAATVKLFNKLLEIKNEDEVFIKKNLPPNITAEQLDALPEKTGVYYLLDNNQEVIYIGKSKNIKSRIMDHFRNYQSMKSVEMTTRVAEIRYKLTGSELIALLLESQEIKEFQPKYNRALRRKSLPWGLYQKLDQGYIRLMVKKTTEGNEPIMHFRTSQSAKGFLHKICKQHRLCQSLCGLYRNVSKSCMLHQLNLCEGACEKLEPPEIYNQRVLEVLDVVQNEESYLLIDEGKEQYQKSVVLIENGCYKGFGYVDEYLLNWGVGAIKEHLGHVEDHKDIYTIIRGYLRKNKVERVVPLKEGFIGDLAE